MTAPRIRAAIATTRRLPGPALVAVIAILAVACGSSAVATGRAPSSVASAVPTPRLTAVPGGPSATAASSVTLPGTTTTEFGTIFDSLPPSFPRLPGQEPADTTPGPTSGSFVANTTVAAAVTTIRTALAGAGWTVDVGSPLEDGSVVLEATGAKAGCKTEVRFTPLSGTVIMSVLYGASCPFG